MLDQFWTLRIDVLKWNCPKKFREPWLKLPHWLHHRYYLTNFLNSLIRFVFIILFRVFLNGYLKLNSLSWEIADKNMTIKKHDQIKIADKKTWPLNTQIVEVTTKINYARIFLKKIPRRICCSRKKIPR